MIQGFNSQLISNDVGTDITTSARPDLPDLCPTAVFACPVALDQNFPNQSGINYVNMSVPSALPLRRGFRAA